MPVYESKKKSFLIIDWSNYKLPLSVVNTHFNDGIDRLIWHHFGLYSTLSGMMVRGVLKVYQDTCKLSQLDTNEQVLHWDEMVPLDAKTAKLLFE